MKAAALAVIPLATALLFVWVEHWRAGTKTETLRDELARLSLSTETRIQTQNVAERFWLFRSISGHIQGAPVVGFAAALIPGISNSSATSLGFSGGVFLAFIVASWFIRPSIWSIKEPYRLLRWSYEPRTWTAIYRSTAIVLFFAAVAASTVERWP